jgi:hypothetical protein
MTNNNTTGAGDERPQAAYVTKEVAEEIAVATCIENTLRSIQMSESGLTEEEVVDACGGEGWMVIVALRLLQLHGFVSPADDGRYRMTSRRYHA